MTPTAAPVAASRARAREQPSTAAGSDASLAERRSARGVSRRRSSSSSRHVREAAPARAPAAVHGAELRDGERVEESIAGDPGEQDRGGTRVRRRVRHEVSEAALERVERLEPLHRREEALLPAAVQVDDDRLEDLRHLPPRALLGSLPEEQGLDLEVATPLEQGVGPARHPDVAPSTHAGEHLERGAPEAAVPAGGALGGDEPRVGPALERGGGDVEQLCRLGRGDRVVHGVSVACRCDPAARGSRDPGGGGASAREDPSRPDPLTSREKPPAPEPSAPPSMSGSSGPASGTRAARHARDGGGTPHVHEDHDGYEDPLGLWARGGHRGAHRRRRLRERRAHRATARGRGEPQVPFLDGPQHHRRGAGVRRARPQHAAPPTRRRRDAPQRARGDRRCVEADGRALARVRDDPARRGGVAALESDGGPVARLAPRRRARGPGVRGAATPQRARRGEGKRRDDRGRRA
jgi:hypothetical protein